MSLTPTKDKKDLPSQTRNTTWSFDWRWLRDGVAIDFTDIEIKFAITDRLGGTNIIELSKGDGITPLSDGVLRFEVQPPDTNIPAETYSYDLRFEENSDTFVYVKGSIRVEQNVTTATEST